MSDVTNTSPVPEAEPVEQSELSPSLGEGVPARRIPRFRTAAEIAATTSPAVPWVARPWTATGAMTELTGKAKKAGKTTWLLRMVRAILEGDDFMGQPTRKGPVVYLTEESTAVFRISLERAGLLERTDLHALNWADTFGVMKWPALVTFAKAECERVGAVLLVVDTISQFAALRGDSENDSGAVMLALEPLQNAAASGLAVLVVRHERKSGGEVGENGRGSTAFTAAVDIVLAFKRPEGATRATIRKIEALSRYDGIPEMTLIELTGDGRYVVLPADDCIAGHAAKAALLAVAPREGEASALPLLDLLPLASGFAGQTIARSTAQEAIADLCDEGLLVRTGKGVKGDPHRFYRILSAGTPTPESSEKTAP